jgi:hypothetical protein
MAQQLMAVRHQPVHFVGILVNQLKFQKSSDVASMQEKIMPKRLEAC